MMLQERITLLTGPSSEPVTEAEAMAHLRLDGEEELAQLHGAIRAARHAVENWTGRALISQSWRFMLDAWPGERGSAWWDGTRPGPVGGSAARFIEMPKPPLISVQQVLLFNDAGEPVVFDAANYFVDAASAPGRLALRNSAAAPAPQRPVNGLQIDFTCGYGAAPGDLPPPLRQAVLMLTAHYFEHREVLRGPGDGPMLPLGLVAALAPYRVVRL
jgi:hypothetical protein